MDNYFSLQVPFAESEKSENKFKYEEMLATSELADTICCYWNFSSCDFTDSNRLSAIKLMKSDINSLQSYANKEILNSKEYSIIKNSRLNIFDSIEQIYLKRGNICISDLAQISNCSIRTLSRKYDDMIGMNPKFMCRIIRFQYTLFCYYNDLEANLSDLAVMSGYYDQSHLYKDFKEFLGISPSRLVFC